MVVLSPAAITVIVCIVVAVVIIVVSLLVWCLCGACDRCGRWSRRRGIARDEVVHDREVADSRREFNEIRQQHDVLRDQIRAKYNLNTDNSNAAVIP